MTRTTTPRPVQATFDNDAEVSDVVAQRPHHVVSGETQVPAAGPSRNQPAPTTQKLDNLILSDDFPRSHSALGKYIVKCFFYLLSAYTKPRRYIDSVTDIDPFITLDSLAIPGKESWTQFPWKTMHSVFGNHSIHVHNWPEGVPFPAIKVQNIEDVIYGKSEDAKAENGQNVRSVVQLPLLDLYLLAKALRDKDYPLHFKVYTDGLATGTCMHFIDPVYS